jgi:hypothetical protein
MARHFWFACLPLDRLFERVHQFVPDANDVASPRRSRNGWSCSIWVLRMISAIGRFLELQGMAAGDPVVETQVNWLSAT